MPGRRALCTGVLGALALAGCGFELRRQAALPFRTLFVQVADSSPFGTELKRSIRAGGGTQVAPRPDQAEAVLLIANEFREKLILSLGGGGRVREFTLRYRVAFRLHDGKSKDYIPLQELVLKRDFSFNDSQVLAKETEEALLFRDMQSDAVQQLIRRLQAVKVDA